MKLQNLAPGNPAPRPLARKADTPPPPPPQDNPNEKDDKIRDQILESLINSPDFTKEAMKRVGRGDKVSISVDGKPVVSISSEGPSVADRMIRGFRAGVRGVTEEVSTVVDNDPAFMLRNAATVVKTQVYNGISSDLQGIADKALIPIARCASLALDGARTVKTWRNKESSWVDRGMDTAHTMCDIAGVLGALAPLCIPALAPHADKLLAVGFAGDIVSYSYRGLQYFNRRSQGDGMPPS